MATKLIKSSDSNKVTFTKEEQARLVQFVKKNNCLHNGVRSNENKTKWEEIGATLNKSGIYIE